jgi:hypothetical protein
MRHHYRARIHMTIRKIIQLAWFTAMPACSQVVMQGETPGGRLYLLPSDASVLDAGEDRKDLPCTFKPIAPKLGFDFSFHVGFQAFVPLRHLAGTDRLTVIFRVTPENNPDAPVYFTQKWGVARPQDDAKGDVVVSGAFISGPGKYHVEWLMRDPHERFCSAHWQISADTRGKDRDVKLSLPAGTVLADAGQPYDDQTLAKSGGDPHPLKVLVLLHVAPRMTAPADARADETATLVAMVRNIAREPRITAYRVVAFNLERNRILYRGRSGSPLDFQALGNTFTRVNPGVIDLQSLRENHSEGQILGDLVDREMAENRPDAIIFVGQRTTEDRLATHTRSITPDPPDCPVFYLNYDANPLTLPTRDPIGRIVKIWKGFEYTITKPHDLFSAWIDVMNRVVNSRTSTALIPKN